MSEQFEAQIAAFEAAGNTVVGRPKFVIGDCSFGECRSGSEVTFNEDVTLCGTQINFPLGGGKLILSRNVRLFAWIHVGPKSVISIGEDTFFNRHCELHAWESASIAIGCGCLLSNIRVRTSDMHSIYDLYSSERINIAKSVEIGNNVWIGEFTTVGKGSRIDDGSVVGAYAFVSGYVPPNCIAVGQPARVVKRGIRWDRSLDMSNPVAMPPTARPVKAMQSATQSVERRSPWTFAKTRWEAIRLNLPMIRR
ncbi:acyltransferase [Methylorubrum extorquens]|uniref:Acyltransferase n=1 Tax=Methylorubrum extorquens TaxID=408 RepID=A0AAX3WBD2_METEX|nr:acyltransferase [Methylorubrum extorquens]WHQ68787.1 acyltransferase [Methylorubrum extorquens]